MCKLKNRGPESVALVSLTQHCQTHAPRRLCRYSLTASKKKEKLQLHQPLVHSLEQRESAGTDQHSTIYLLLEHALGHMRVLGNRRSANGTHLWSGPWCPINQTDNEHTYQTAGNETRNLLDCISPTLSRHPKLGQLTKRLLESSGHFDTSKLH